ncbi:methyl-accepting chemotaxis protein [Roseateles sp. DC23W]|uniref:Methyl-accepting chemotaxis protein n=1 Tax=Pelomonas dachongensis TaxID=3299029 RepID=A0ABW7EUY7_9BURK
MKLIRMLASRVGLSYGRHRRQLNALYRNQAIVEFDAQGNVLYGNARFRHLMEYRPEEMRGQHHRLFIDPTSQDEGEYREFWARLQRGEAFMGRCKRRTRSGKVVWLQANYSPVLDAAGRVTRVVKYAMDISAEVLRDAEASSQMDAVGRAQAVIEFTLDGHILRCNDNFLGALGYGSERELVGRHHRLFVAAEERESAEYAAFWRHLASGHHHRGQFRRIGRDGNEVWIEANYSAVLDQAGKPFKVVKYATDITARVQATRLVQDAFGQLNQLVAASAARADEAHSQATQAAAVAGSGEVAVKGAVEAMVDIRANSQRIGDMVGLIEGLAFQTNLLALNAAVEAARAGEQGRGFAVVASEVRLLAQRSAEAAKEIKQIIGASSASVERGYARVQDAGRMLHDMCASAERASTIMDGITQSSRAQQARLGAVHQAVAQLESAVISG